MQSTLENSILEQLRISLVADDVELHPSVVAARKALLNTIVSAIPRTEGMEDKRELAKVLQGSRAL